MPCGRAHPERGMDQKRGRAAQELYGAQLFVSKRGDPFLWGEGGTAARCCAHTTSVQYYRLHGGACIEGMPRETPRVFICLGGLLP